MSILDITFCDSDCKNKKCERNKRKIPNGYCVSCADFSANCEKYKKTKSVELKLKIDDLRRVIMDDRQRLDRRKILSMLNDIDKLLLESVVSDL